MDIAQPGVILFTQNYPACVAFYRDKLGLPVTQEKETLTKFAFGPAYLMVEVGGPPAGGEKTRAQNPTILRFDVADVRAAADELIGRGVEVEVRTLPWGSIGIFLDPDGNRCELKNFG